MASQMPFTKMQGAGNDYVYINGFKERPENIPELARAISDRHFGVGSDGLVLVLPSDVADVRMRMFNADGTEAEMCGNASRCVAKFAYDNGLAKKDEISLETLAGIKKIKLIFSDGKVIGATVDMGEPEIRPDLIPVQLPGPKEAAIGENIAVGGKDYEFTAVSMGNPHAVLFMAGIDKLDLPALGPQFERHSFFPKRINTEFVEVLDRGHIKMRVWERGAGETLACGTGACAALVACVLNNLTERKATVDLRGGRLEINWDAATNHVFMTGPAVTVFDGIFFLPEK